MGTFFVVNLDPLGADLANLVEILEHVGVQHLFPIRPVEPLDLGILVRLARLDVTQLDRMAFAPGDKYLS